MNKMIMNRLTMLAVTLMASMACFAQGKFDKGLTTSIPQGVPVGETFVYKELEYLVIENASGTYQTQVVGFCPAVLNNPNLMDNGDGNKFTPHSIEIPHYVPADNAPAMLVLSVAPDAFNTTNISSTLAAKVTNMKIDYQGEMEEVKNLNGEGGVVLPTTGSTFDGLTALTEVKPLAPADKVAPISKSSFDASVYKTASLIVPESEGSFLAYAKTAGWREFCKLYKNGSTTMLGDTNGDGKLTIGDAQNVLTLIAKIKAGTASYNEIYDINGDGKITIADAQDLITKYQKSK